jgi:hypothetical protein
MIFRANFFTFIVLMSDAILASEAISWTNKQNAGEQQAG